jgi:uncharacterized protein YukE
MALELSPEMLTGAIVVGGAAVKLIGTLVDQVIRKYSPQKEQTLTLDPVISQMLGVVASKVGDIDVLLTKTDNEGIPMVYSSRQLTEYSKVMAKDLAELAHHQVEIAQELKSFKEKFETHDREDHIYFSKLTQVMEGMAKGVSDNRDSLIRSASNHEQAMAKLEKIQDEMRGHDQRVAAAIQNIVEIKQKVG